MKKTKLEKGITLIALIITIIVLLILAVVAIGTVQESDIIVHTQNAADKYNTEKEIENTTLGEYENEISKYQGKTDSDDTEEIMWVYYEEDDHNYLIFTGTVQELTLDANKEIKANEFVVTGTETNSKGDEVRIWGNSNNVVTKKIGEVSRIYMHDEDVLGENSTSNIEKLIMSQNTQDLKIELYGASSIKNIKFEDGIKKLNYEICIDLTSLISVELPLTLEEIELDAFYGCTVLKTINFAGTKAQWNSIQIADGAFDDVPSDAKVICTDGETPLFPTTN